MNGWKKRSENYPLLRHIESNLKGVKTQSTITIVVVVIAQNPTTAC